MAGVQSKTEELQDFGFTILTRRVEFDLHAQLAAIDSLMEAGIHGLMLTPYNHPLIQQKIDELPAADPRCNGQYRYRGFPSDSLCRQ